MSAPKLTDAGVLTLTYDGRTLSLRDWSRVRSVYLLGIGVGTLRKRVADGWSPERALTTPAAPRTTRGSCTVCGVHVERPGSLGLSRLRCVDCARSHAADTGPVKRYCDDPEAQRFVAEHEDGATLDEIGVVLGISRERVRQIEAIALERFLARCALAGLSREDLTLFVSQRQHPLDYTAPAPRNTSSSEAEARRTVCQCGKRKSRRSRACPTCMGIAEPKGPRRSIDECHAAVAIDRRGPSDTTIAASEVVDGWCERAEAAAARFARVGEVFDALREWASTAEIEP